MTIANHPIQNGGRVFIIAELSANHNHDIDRALQLIHEAKAAGADAIKLQTYRAETITLNSDRPEFRIQGTMWEGKRLYDLYEEAFLPWEWHGQLFKEAQSIGLAIFSTPFDFTSVDFLEQFDPPAYKIASFELVDIPLIQKVASTGRPLIMSTGMGTFLEIAEAVDAARNAGCKDLALLKCTSAYPAPIEEANVRRIPQMAEAFGVPTGLSDHTLGSAVALAATALGSCVLEKHFTLARKDGGPDSAFSMEPHEFKAMVEQIRIVEQAMGSTSYELTPKEHKSRAFRKSLFAVKDIAQGDPFTEDNVKSIRPSHGLSPKYWGQVMGRRAAGFIERGTPLSWDLLA